MKKERDGRGRLTVPKELRERLGLDPGDLAELPDEEPAAEDRVRVVRTREVTVEIVEPSRRKRNRESR